MSLAMAAKLATLNSDLEAVVIVRDRSSNQVVMTSTDDRYDTVLRCIDIASYVAHVRFCETVYELPPNVVVETAQRSNECEGEEGAAFDQAVDAVRKLINLGFSSVVAQPILAQLTHAYYSVRQQTIERSPFIN
jgi:hypothetical protein